MEPPSCNTIQLYFSFDLIKSDLANVLRGVVPLREEFGEPAQAAHQQVNGFAQELLPDGAAQLQHNTTLLLIRSRQERPRKHSAGNCVAP
jgi:hypothetical protein